MKISIALAAAILIIGIVPGLLQRQHLIELREEHRALVAEAMKLGISVTDADESRQTKKQRVDTAKQAGAVADEIVSFYVDMETSRINGGEQDQAVLDRGLEMKSRLLAMDASLLRQVIAALENKPGIPDEAKREIIGTTLLHLSGEYPEKALELVTQVYDLLKGTSMGHEIITSSFQSWAEDSPDSALSWLQSHAEEYPGIAGDIAKRAVIFGTAVNDPAHAFKLISQLQPDDKAAAVQAIIASGQETPEKSDLALAALRQHLTTVSDTQERDELRAKAFESFARHLSDGGFDAGTAWVAKAGFSTEEKERFSAGLSYFSTKQETGRWIDWLSTNLAAESVAGPVSSLVSEWTQKDHQSAGKWLLTMGDGPAKDSAVQAYSTAVSAYEPAVAEQWAMTLPAGPARDSTLRAIFQNWPADDPDGAATFAHQHGLKK